MTIDEIREWYEANKGRIVPEEQEMMIKMIGELLAEAERSLRLPPTGARGQ